MSFFFRYHPTTEYTLKGKTFTFQNMFLRYRLLKVLENRSMLYYEHELVEGQSLQYIAERYYEDSSLDWVILITNNIVDPQFDLPLEYQDFINYVKGKYGSVESAMGTTHHYEQIIQAQSVLADGTIVPEKILEIDFETFAGLAATETRDVSQYDYEEYLNEKKRIIKVLHRDYLEQFLDEAEGIIA